MHDVNKINFVDYYQACSYAIVVNYTAFAITLELLKLLPFKFLDLRGITWPQPQGSRGGQAASIVCDF